MWSRSCHTKLIDVQLNTAMRTVTGTLQATPVPWLPVLSNIVPPQFRREEATAKMLAKIKSNVNLPIHKDVTLHPPRRLPSRRPIWTDVPLEHISTASKWRDSWQTCGVINSSLIDDPSVRPPGFDLPRRSWALLNRFRSGQGRCATNLVRWGQATDPHCSCGDLQTMLHIVNDCPQTRFAGGLSALHLATDEARYWLSTNCKR